MKRLFGRLLRRIGNKLVNYLPTFTSITPLNTGVLPFMNFWSVWVVLLRMGWGVKLLVWEIGRSIVLLREWLM